MKKILFFISIFCLSFSLVNANTLLEKYGISVGNGKTIWIKLERSLGCYNLLMGSSNSSLYGNGSNCSKQVNNYWSVYGCGNHGSTNGGVSEAVNKMLQLCSQ